MLSKNKIKFINSIKKKKYRDINQCFFAEGEKLVDELINSDIKITEIYATIGWIELNHQLLTKNNISFTEISEIQLKNISSLTTPNKVFAIAQQASYNFNIKNLNNKLNLFLENINDPGNLGTIIRIADWFGIENIFCTKESVDMYNPKVVQASMGAIYRTKIHYVEVNNFFNDLKSLKNFTVYGTFLDGDNIYKEDLNQNGLIVMGSESHGISETLNSFVNKRIFIPNYPIESRTSESLNISTATSIVCSEFRRRI